MGKVRKTRQSQLILDIINHSKDHLSANAIYDKARLIIENISLGTVYRNLATLVDLGEIKKIRTNDGMDHYDNILTKHNHFICNKCNDIIDIWDNPQLLIDNTYGEVMNYEIYYRGICNKCLKEEKHGIKR